MIHLLIFYDRLEIVASISPHQCEGSTMSKLWISPPPVASRAVCFPLRGLRASQHFQYAAGVARQVSGMVDLFLWKSCIHLNILRLPQTCHRLIII
jgi:hypothetical protein